MVCCLRLACLTGVAASTFRYAVPVPGAGSGTFRVERLRLSRAHNRVPGQMEGHQLDARREPENHMWLETTEEDHSAGPGYQAAPVLASGDLAYSLDIRLDCAGSRIAEWP